MPIQFPTQAAVDQSQVRTTEETLFLSLVFIICSVILNQVWYTESFANDMLVVILSEHGFRPLLFGTGLYFSSGGCEVF